MAAWHVALYAAYVSQLMCTADVHALHGVVWCGVVLARLLGHMLL